MQVHYFCIYRYILKSGARTGVGSRSLIGLFFFKFFIEHSCLSRCQLNNPWNLNYRIKFSVTIDQNDAQVRLYSSFLEQVSIKNRFPNKKKTFLLQDPDKLNYVPVYVKRQICLSLSDVQGFGAEAVTLARLRLHLKYLFINSRKLHGP